ncbi:MAG: ABC transporter ATP-binding protein, partial [Akkermansia sp.]
GDLLPQVAVVGGLTLLVCALGVASSVLFHQSTNRFQDELRLKLWRHFNTMPAQQFEQSSIGHWQSKLLYDVSVLSSSTQIFISALVPALILLVGGVCIIASKQPLMLVLVLVAVLLNGGIFALFKRTIFSSAERYRKSVMKQNQLLIDLVSLIPIIKIFRLHEKFMSKLDENLCETRALNITLQNKTVYLHSLMGLSAELVKWLILAISIVLYLKGLVSMGEVVLYQMLISQALSGVTQMFSISGQVEIARDSYFSLQEFFARELPPELPDTLLQGQGDDGDIISFTDCSFSYEGADVPIFEGLNLSIPRYSSLCIYGRMGVGKTTMTKMIAGLYPPTRGEMQLKLAHTTPTPLVSIGQNIPIFESSLLENIRLFDERITEECILATIESLELGHFFARFNCDLQAPVSWASLSGGQIQCVGILRALVRQPEILILDEGTNNLDIAARLTIYQFIEKLKGKLTIVAITHDLDLFPLLDAAYLITNKQVQRLQSEAQLRAALLEK